MAPVILAILIAGGFTPQLDCVTIKSPSKLSAGSAFRVALHHGLEFRLSKAWQISVGPAGDQTDYLWLVSPPLHFAPQRFFGRSYYVSAAESMKLQRSLRFVINRQDYDAALAAGELDDAAESLRRLDILGRGVLILYIDKYELDGETLRWISFHGEACVPK
jgi:hypothetical protein